MCVAPGKMRKDLVEALTLATNAPGTENLHIYAHCHPNIPGAVTLLAINLDQRASRTLEMATGGLLYRLTVADEGPEAAALNGKTLSLGADDRLPQLSGQTFTAGEIRLDPASNTFLVVTDAANPDCGQRREVNG